MAKRIRNEDLFTKDEIKRFRAIIMRVKKWDEPPEGTRNLTLEDIQKKLLATARADALDDPDNPEAFHNKLKDNPVRAIEVFIDEIDRGNRPRRPSRVSTGSDPSVFARHRVNSISATTKAATEAVKPWYFPLYPSRARRALHS